MTATIVGALLWAHARESRRNAQPSARKGTTYVSTNASRGDGPITVEVPRLQPRTAPAMAMLGGHQPPARHSQDYWEVFADVTATIFEAREDDPPLRL